MIQRRARLILGRRTAAAGAGFTLPPVRARVAVITLFLLMGTVMGSWAGRIPTVRQQVGLDDAQWGLVILASPLGSLIALLVITRVIPRTGGRLLVLPGAVATLCVVPITASSQQVWALGSSLLLQGMSVALLSIPMNALAVMVEKHYARRIMSTFHACFSLGQLGGGLAGAGAAAWGISPALQLTVTNVVLAVALLATSVRWLPHDRSGRAPGAAATQGRRVGPRRPWSLVTPQLALLAAIGLLSSINEGAAVQWSAQYAAVGLSAGASMGALTFTCFSIAMTSSRLFGDRLVDRFGRIRFLRYSALLASAGMATGLAMGNTAGGFIAFALLGVGSACIVPTVIGLAGSQPGLAPGRGVSIVSLGSWPAFMIGPPLIGAIAGAVGLRYALGFVVLTTLSIALLAGRIRAPEQPAAGTASEPAAEPAAGPAAAPAGDKTPIAPAALVRAERTGGLSVGASR